jgi:hypothetical protein
MMRVPARPHVVALAPLVARGPLERVTIAASSLAAIGCGRKASEADCALLLDRNVEVAMKAMNVTDPVAIQKRKDEIRGQMKEDMKDCVGKRITDGMLACVRKAETAAAIDDCMR